MFKLKNNFLDPKTVITTKRFLKSKVLKISLIIIGFLCLILLILSLIYWKPVKTIYTEAMSGKDNFLKAQDQLLKQEFDESGISLDQAINDFKKAQADFSKLKWMKYIPFVGIQIRAVENLLGAGVNTGEAIQKIVVLGKDIITPIKENPKISIADLSPEQTREILRKIYESKPVLEATKAQIDVATEYVNKIPEKFLLKKIKKAVDPIKEKVPLLQKGIAEAINATQIIPPLVGYPDKKTYLFLLENNTELRPSGGFIGTYGILKVQDGNIVYFRTDNIYNLDLPAESSLNVEPPWPLTRYNKVYKWFMRDSNWSPDFPTSAKQAEWFYLKEGGFEKNIDGVIALTPTFIESLLKLTGEITINGVKFNSENVVDTLQYQVDQGFLRQGLSDSERKEIIGALSESILSKLLSLPKNKWPDLWQTILKDLKEKQILIFLQNDGLQKQVLAQNWGGQVKDLDYDYLTVVDANLASLKSDPGVKRTIEYTFTKKDQNLIGQVVIKYDNKGTLTWKTTRYRSYVRIYVPLGSELIEVKGAMIDCKIDQDGSVEKTEELNKSVFGTFICIEPSEQKTLSFKYKLPVKIAEQIKNGGYKLLIQKQAGTIGYDLIVNLNFDQKIKWIIPFDKLNDRSDNKLKFNYDLREDREFIITL